MQRGVPRRDDAPAGELAVLGFDDPFAARVYSTLVSEPGATAATLADRTGVHTAQVEVALRSLAAAGLVTGDGDGWDAVAPEAVLGARLATQEDAVREARRMVGVLEREHRAARRSARPEDVVEIVSGAEAVGRRLFELQRTARTAIRGLDRPPYVSVRPGGNRDLLSRIDDGLDVRVVFDGEAAAWPHRLTGEVLESRRRGDHVRIAERLPAKVFVVDDDVALVPVVSTQTSLQQAAYVIHRGALLDALIALFESEWSRATPLPTPPDEPTAALLALLGAGQTDLVIGRALGVSERTVQRRIQGLLTELGVTTRFQLGLLARERGWL